MILHFIVILAFSLGSFGSLVNAAPCSHDMQKTIEQMQMADMPCHDMERDNDMNKKPEQKHCKGICLCAFVTAPVLVLPDLITASQDYMRGQAIEKIVVNSTYSLANPPPFEPPKNNS